MFDRRGVPDHSRRLECQRRAHAVAEQEGRLRLQPQERSGHLSGELADVVDTGLVPPILPTGVLHGDDLDPR